MNPEHLKEQQEALEAASQELEFRRDQVRSTHRSGWLASTALLAAIIVPVWLYHTDNQQNRDAGLNAEIQGLKLSDLKQQDAIGALRNDSARQDKSNEKLED